MLKSKKQKEPLTRCSGTMTESAYLAWIRSCLRSKSLRWKPRTDCLEAARRPYKGPNKRQKYEYQCAICKEWYKADDVVVDHYPEEAGSILCAEDIGPFAERLFCEVDNLRCLDVWCHRVWTYQSSHEGCSWEEAVLEIRVNDALKKEAKKNTLALLQEKGYNCKNDEQRKQALREIFQKEK